MIESKNKDFIPPGLNISPKIGIDWGFISSALIGYFSVKLDEIYFAMLTLGFGMMFFTLVHQWRSFTGGSVCFTERFDENFGA